METKAYSVQPELGLVLSLAKSRVLALVCLLSLSGFALSFLGESAAAYLDNNEI